MPNYHALGRNAAPPDLLWVNDIACHGNFRNWANVTFPIQQAREGDALLAWFRRDTVRMVLSYLGSSVCGRPYRG